MAPAACSPCSAKGSPDELRDLLEERWWPTDEQAADHRLAPARQVVADLPPRADERGVLDHRRRDRRDRVGAAASEEGVLHLRADVLVPHAREDLVVEVHLARAHAADVERDRRPHGVGGLLDVVVDDDRDARRDLEIVELTMSPGARKAFGERGTIEGIELR